VEPQFLTLAEVLEIHRDQIERYGGDYHLRDAGLLESALAMPSAGIRGEYFHADLPEMAAAYAFFLVKNHPFIDGNKRVGAVAAIVFLKLNGVKLVPKEGELEELIMGVARGEIEKDQLAAFFRANSD
jgi:death-on-curing protein